VIQNDTSNRVSDITMVAPITSRVRLSLSPLHVLLPASRSTGLTVASVAVFNQIQALDRQRLIKKLGAADALVLLQVDGAMKAAFLDWLKVLLMYPLSLVPAFSPARSLFA
jgi:mRNA-degrading endonuclease toxin of MazEF toxin-antitoxin module